MAKRRKVGNLLALAILATLVERPMHPYELATVLRERGKDTDMKINWGSLYTVVDNLARHGFIEAVETVREGRRPERTIYRITPAGRAELHDWVRELVGVPEREHHRFEAALSTMGVLSPEEVVGLLERRLAVLEQQIGRERATLAHLVSEIPRLFLVEVEYRLALQQAEVDWLRGLVAELSSGQYPGMDLWRQYREAADRQEAAQAAHPGGEEAATG